MTPASCQIAPKVAACELICEPTAAQPVRWRGIYRDDWDGDSS